MKLRIFASLFSLSVIFTPSISFGQGNFNCLETYVLDAPVAIATGTPTFISFVGNVVRLAQHKHAPGWGTMGVVSGILGVIANIALLSKETTAYCQSGKMALNVPMLILNLASIGFGTGNLINLRNTRVQLPSRTQKKDVESKLILVHPSNSSQNDKTIDFNTSNTHSFVFFQN